MLRQSLKTIAIIVFASIAAGCTMFKADPQQSERCTKMKRELLYNDSNRNIEANWATSEQRVQFKQQIKDAHCK
jgi:hypothetical protein